MKGLKGSRGVALLKEVVGGVEVSKAYVKPESVSVSPTPQRPPTPPTQQDQEVNLSYFPRACLQAALFPTLMVTE